MSIVFSARNDDIYIVRVDLPHKGEERFHINMEEIIGETILPTGYPMTIQEYRSYGLDYNNKVFDNLFFELNEKIWFRSKFDSILKQQEITEEKKNKYNELFHKQSHIEIQIETDEVINCNNQIEFVNEVKKYLKILNIPESFYLSFGKEDISYSKETKKIRGLFEMEQYLHKIIMSHNGECRVKVNEIPSVLEKYLDVEINNMKEIQYIYEVGDLINEIMLS